MSHLLRTPRTCASVVACARQFAHGSDPGSADEALVEAFVARNEHAAFALIVQRHGPMVLRVCRRVLADRHAAEDAFQGTFLILAQHAKAIRKRSALASWLHGTALRVASGARRAAERARATEPADTQPGSELGPALSAAWREVQALVDQEVLALPAIYREAFVRCCLEHASCAEVARELGVSEPTVRNRLARARKRLQERLGRRGVSLATVVAALAASAVADAVPAAPLVVATADAACALASGQALAALAVRKSVISLVAGASRNMFLTKLKAAVGVLVLCTAVCALATGEAIEQPNQFPDQPLADPKPAHNLAVAAELAKLEGVWLTEKYDEVSYYVFAGNKCTIINATKKEADESRVEIDPAKSPKWLTLTESGNGNWTGTWEQIYELKGDTLRLAAQLGFTIGGRLTLAPRPTEFKDVDSKSRLLTLKRLTPPAVAPPKAPRVGDREVPKGLSVPPKAGAPDAQHLDIPVLEAQVRVKQARVKAAQVHLEWAQTQAKLLANSPVQEQNNAKIEVAAVAADLEVRKAELLEAEAKLRATAAKTQRPPGALERLNNRSHPTPKAPGRVEPQTLNVNARLMSLPLALDPAQRKDVKELQLYVSENDGRTWELVARTKPDADKVTYTAPLDGVYCFGLRVLKTDGTTAPPAGAELSIDLRVRVESANPLPPAPLPPAPWKKAFDETYTPEGGPLMFVPHTHTTLAVQEAYYREVTMRGKKGAKPPPGSVFVFRTDTGRVTIGGGATGGPGKTGMALERVIQEVLPELQGAIELDPKLLGVYLDGDWVLRSNDPFEDRRSALEIILTSVCEVPVRLKLSETERSVLVASGTFKFAVRPWRNAGEIDVYARETSVDKKLERISKHTAGRGDLSAFLGEVGTFCNRYIAPGEVNGAPFAVDWFLHERNSDKVSEQREDHDPDAVLKNVSEQTGLVFKTEKRPVRTLVVTVAEAK